MRLLGIGAASRLVTVIHKHNIISITKLYIIFMITSIVFLIDYKYYKKKDRGNIHTYITKNSQLNCPSCCLVLSNIDHPNAPPPHLSPWIFLKSACHHSQPLATLKNTKRTTVVSSGTSKLRNQLIMTSINGIQTFLWQSPKRGTAKWCPTIIPRESTTLSSYRVMEVI